jgi:hypothetical protein
MIVAAFSSLALSAALAHAAPVPAVADSLPFDTTQVVVTQNDFTQLKDFLQATTTEWSKKDVGGLMSRHVVKYPLALGDLGGATAPPQIKTGTLIPIPNYQVVSDSNPIVAKGFASAKLSAPRYMQLSRTLNNAFITEQLDRILHNGSPKSTDTTTVIGKNVAFIRANQAAFNGLVQLALDVTPLRQNGGGMGGGMGANDDLNP